MNAPKPVVVPAGTPMLAALADIGIRPKAILPGHPQHDLLCPRCEGGRSRDKSFTLTVDPDALGAVWCCHRGTCGWTGNLIVSGRRTVVPFARVRREVRPPPLIPLTDQSKPATMYEWFADRGIDADTVDAFGCYVTKHWFFAKGDIPEGFYPGIVFPYIFDRVVVNRKYRTRNKQMVQEKDPLHTLYNIDSIIDTGHAVWVEGEGDCLACHQAGWKQVVSLKDGAPDKVRAEDDPKREFDRRYEALSTHAALLEKIEKFYLAGDMDEPGIALREELARRLGRHRCWIVTWPKGCKDAGDTLKQCGEDVVAECLDNAKPYPIDDIQQITGDVLDEYLERPPPPVLTTGMTALDRVVRLPGEGRLIVVTGIPSSGKSQLTMAVMMHLLLRENRRFLVFSPEMQPWEEFATQCAQVLVGKTARRDADWQPGQPVMSREERRNAGDWMNERLLFLAADSEDKAPTLEWILDRANQASLRLGITDLLIDPWNEIEHQRGGLTETDYTGRALQKLKGFGFRHGCNIWIIAHPTKMRPPLPGDDPVPPGPYDISGSSHWSNKADIGMTIHTPHSTTQVILWKARFKRWGKKNDSTDLLFDPATGRYSSPHSIQMEHGYDPWEKEKFAADQASEQHHC